MKRSASRLWTLVAVALFLGGPIYCWWWDASWLWAAGGAVLGVMVGTAACHTAAEFVAETTRENPTFKEEMIEAGVIMDDDNKTVHPGPSANETWLAVNAAQEIVSYYGAYIEHNPVTLEIGDEKELPHPKEMILDAICVILLIERDVERREALISCALTLANFQPNIGKDRLYPYGVDFVSFDISAATSEEHAAKGEKILVEFAAGGSEAMRYDSLKPNVKQDIERMGERVRKANQSFNESDLSS